MFAILLFALAGLISGFAVGAFVHPKNGGINGTGTGITPVTQGTQATTSAPIHPVRLGDPVINVYHSHEIADGTTNYVFTVYAVDQSIDKHNGKRISATGISGKLWLQHIPNDDFANLPPVSLPDSRLRKLDIQGPLTNEEIAGALNFASGAAQIQQTDASGQITWNYTVATSVPPGHYYLVVLLDWNGQESNWSWRLVTIASSN